MHSVLRKSVYTEQTAECVVQLSGHSIHAPQRRQALHIAARCPITFGFAALAALARGVLEAVMRSGGGADTFGPLASDSTGNGASCNVSGD